MSAYDPFGQRSGSTSSTSPFGHPTTPSSNPFGGSGSSGPFGGAAGSPYGSSPTPGVSSTHALFGTGGQSTVGQTTGPFAGVATSAPVVYDPSVRQPAAPEVGRVALLPWVWVAATVALVFAVAGLIFSALNGVRLTTLRPSLLAAQDKLTIAVVLLVLLLGTFIGHLTSFRKSARVATFGVIANIVGPLLAIVLAGRAGALAMIGHLEAEAAQGTEVTQAIQQALGGNLSDYGWVLGLILSLLKMLG